jgi:hypothetical protein
MKSQKELKETLIEKLKLYRLDKECRNEIFGRPMINLDSLSEILKKYSQTEMVVKIAGYPFDEVGGSKQKCLPRKFYAFCNKNILLVDTNKSSDNFRVELDLNELADARSYLSLPALDSLKYSENDPHFFCEEKTVIMLGNQEYCLEKTRKLKKEFDSVVKLCKVYRHVKKVRDFAETNNTKMDSVIKSMSDWLHLTELHQTENKKRLLCANYTKEDVHITGQFSLDHYELPCMFVYRVENK